MISNATIPNSSCIFFVRHAMSDIRYLVESSRMLGVYFFLISTNSDYAYNIPST